MKFINESSATCSLEAIEKTIVAFDEKELCLIHSWGESYLFYGNVMLELGFVASILVHISLEMQVRTAKAIKRF